MTEEQRGTRERSGCALVLGILLIAFGSLFLAVNLGLLDWSALRVLRRGLVLYADYWPLILVAWGAYKVLRYFTAPERARVGFFEVVFLIFVVGFGLTLRTARRFATEIGAESSFDELFDFVELEVIGAPPHRFTQERSWELDPAAASLTIENGTGAVDVVGGESDRIDVVLTTRVHHLSESEAARLTEAVSLDFSNAEGGAGAQARLSVRTPERRARLGTDLKLVVPRRVSLTLSNREGPVTVRGLMGAVDVTTSHDAVDLRDLGGGVRARTSHARILIENVVGNVGVENRRGSIDVRRVRGDLKAATSFEAVAIEDVEGAAIIENRHSRVRADRISGSIEIRGEHVEVAAESVGGSVTVQTAHAPVFVRAVKGGATIESRSEEIHVLDVTGDVEVRGPHSDVTLSRVGGAARIGSGPSEVSVDDASGPLTIEGASERVRVTNFLSGLEIRSTHADLVVSTAVLAGDVVLETTYGNVELALPRSASARVAARTRDGDFRRDASSAEFVETSENGERRWEATVGDGSHAVQVATRHGNVRLRQSP